jgi:hypothetical protein
VSAALGAALVIGGLAAALALAKRRGAAAPPPLVVEARVSLGKDSGVALVRCAGRALLVGWGSGGVSTLATVDEVRP